MSRPVMCECWSCQAERDAAAIAALVAFGEVIALAAIAKLNGWLGCEEGDQC